MDKWQKIATSDLGLMIQPDTGTNLKILNEGTLFGIDNGCYRQGEKFSLKKYLKRLKVLQKLQKQCLFATAPDVVGNARETWKRSEEVLPEIRALGYKAALVAQDGMEDYPIRWGAFDCLFIGGSTKWKLSEDSFQIAKEARQNGCWIHLGRVNSRRRIRIAYQAGCDSVDGTHLVFKPDKHLDQLKRWMEELRKQPFLQGL